MCLCRSLNRKIMQADHFEHKKLSEQSTPEEQNEPDEQNGSEEQDGSEGQSSPDE
jgi:hypothetical protein